MEFEKYLLIVLQNAVAITNSLHYAYNYSSIITICTVLAYMLCCLCDDSVASYTV